MIEWAINSTDATDLARLDFAPGSPERTALSGRGLVVVAVSGSRASRAATVVAAELARAWGGRLRVVHVVPAVHYRVGRLAPMRAVPRRLVDPFDSPVLASARELAWRHGVAATLELLAGEPAHMIVTAATRADADVLVIGAVTRSTRPSARRFAGRGLGSRRWIERAK